MVNLIRNENMKIYRRMRTWVMVGILILLVGAWSTIVWFDTGRHMQGDGWRTELEQQIENNQQLLADKNTLENFKKELEKQNAMLQHQLDENIKPLGATMWGNVIDLAGLVFVITLFVVIVAGDSLAGEFSTGTIKLLLIRPASRTKIMLSKYVSSILFGLFLLVVLFAASILINGAFYGFSGWDQPFLKVTEDGELVEKNMLLHLWGTYLLNAVSTVMYVTMAFMISAVFRSSAMAIGISIFAMFAGDIITMFLSRYEWSKYLLFANIDLSQYLNGRPFMEGMTMGFSVTVLLVYFAVFNVLAWLVFTKRDVAA